MNGALMPSTKEFLTTSFKIASELLINESVNKDKSLIDKKMKD